MLRRILAAAAVVLGVLTVMVFGATVASATAKSCTQHTWGRVCNTTYGSGARVDHVLASRDKYFIKDPYICDYSADISVLDGRNRAHVKYFAHPSHVGCIFGDYAGLDQAVHRVFACGDVVSVRWYDRDGASGYANRTLC